MEVKKKSEKLWKYWPAALSFATGISAQDAKRGGAMDRDRGSLADS